MPFETKVFQLPGGARGFRLDASGTLSEEDGAALLKLVAPGGELYGLPGLVLTRNLRSISPEARRIYAARGDLGDREMWMAVVVTNPVLRVTARFLMRVQKARKIELFAGEQEAISWLDARAREDAAAKRGAP